MRQSFKVHIPLSSATVGIKRQPAGFLLTGCMIQRAYIKGCDDLPPIESRTKIRCTIAQLHKQGSSLRSIARTIEVHVSTVSRELRRIVTSVVIAPSTPSTRRCSLTSELLGGSILAASPALFRLV